MSDSYATTIHCRDQVVGDQHAQITNGSTERGDRRDTAGHQSIPRGRPHIDTTVRPRFRRDRPCPYCIKNVERRVSIDLTAAVDDSESGGCGSAQPVARATRVERPKPARTHFVAAGAGAKRSSVVMPANWCGNLPAISRP